MQGYNKVTYRKLLGYIENIQPINSPALLTNKMKESKGFTAIKAQKIIVFSVLLLQVTILNSQTHALRFKRITSQQGLTANRIDAVMQDADGALWIGNKIGINRYDGEIATVYHAGENNSINQFFQDTYKNIWAATEKGLYFFEKAANKFVKIKTHSQKAEKLFVSNILCISNITENELLIGGTKDFLVKFKINNKGQIINNAITILDKHKINGYVTKIVKDYHSKIWLSTNKGEVLKLENDLIEESGFAKSGNQSYINDISADVFNNLWIATNGGGLYCYNFQNNTVKHFLKDENMQHKTINNNVVTKVYTAGQNVWIGTDGGGLNLYEQDKKIFNYYQYAFGNEFSLSDNSIIDIQPGLNDAIFLGTVHGGISIFRNNYKIENIPARNFNFLIEDPQGSRVIEDSFKNLWISAGRTGLRRYNPKTKVLSVFSGNEKGFGYKGDIVLSLFEDNSKRLWVGTLREGVNVYDLDKNKFIELPKSRNLKGVFSIAEDNQNCIWVGHRKGINVYSSDLKLQYTISPVSNPNSNSNQVNCIYKDINGIMWVGTTDGLFKYDKRGNRFFKSTYKHSIKDHNSISSNYILSIRETHDHSILVGTYGEGVNVYSDKTGKFKKIINGDRIKGGIIRGILLDHQNNIWLSTNIGLTKIDLKNNVTNFGTADGVYPFNGGSAALDSNGNIMMAGVYGLSYFNPEKLNNKTYFPHVYFTSVKAVNGKNESVYSFSSLQNDTVYIEPGYNKLLNINFSSSELYSKSSVEYQFLMAGLDENWQNLDGQNKISLSNLNPGKYQLKVRATNNLKVWDQKFTTLCIVVKPSFWEKPVVRIMLCLYFIAMLIVIYNLRTSTIKKQKQKLQKLLDLKTIEVKQQEQKISQSKISILEFEKQNEVLKQKKLEDELTFKIDELTNNTLRSMHKNNLLNDIKDNLKIQLKSKSIDKTSLENIVSLINDSFILDDDWESFYTLFNQVHPAFIKSLKKLYPVLSEREVRLCALILIDFSSQDMATLFGISLTSIKVARHRLRKKLNISSSQSFKQFMLDIPIQ